MAVTKMLAIPPTAKAAITTVRTVGLRLAFMKLSIR